MCTSNLRVHKPLSTNSPRMCDVLVASGFVANHVVEMDQKGHVTIYTANTVMIKRGTHVVCTSGFTYVHQYMLCYIILLSLMLTVGLTEDVVTVTEGSSIHAESTYILYLQTRLSLLGVTNDKYIQVVFKIAAS